MVPTMAGVPMRKFFDNFVTEMFSGLIVIFTDGISDLGMVPPPVLAVLGAMVQSFCVSAGSEVMIFSARF